MFRISTSTNTTTIIRNRPVCGTFRGLREASGKGYAMLNITYSQAGDYLIPKILLSEPPDAEPLTKYGLMRKRFLKEHQPVAYGRMLLSEKLYPHCREVQSKAENMLQTLMDQLTQSNPPPDKVVDGLAWAAHMNMLTHIAEESIFVEIVYENKFI